MRAMASKTAEALACAHATVVPVYAAHGVLMHQSWRVAHLNACVSCMLRCWKVVLTRLVQFSMHFLSKRHTWMSQVRGCVAVSASAGAASRLGSK